MAKGGSFEREMAKAFSLWWTDQKRDDVFWRTSNSGGRATVRGRQGKKTHGQHGDLQATDPVGAPLTNLLSIELKRGYKDAHLGDLIDIGPAQRSLRPLEEFIGQALREAREAEVPFWLLIIRRDQRQALVFIPHNLYTNLLDAGARGLKWGAPWVHWRLPIRREGGGFQDEGSFLTMKLEDFFDRVKPDHIRFLERDFCG